jgi:hypothetical protein
MPFLHHQTYETNLTPELATNWNSIVATNTQRVTTRSLYPSGTLTPQVGSYFWSQFNGGSVQYNNNINSTWNEWTVEGWVTAYRSSTQQTLQSIATSLTIGDGSSYLQFQIVPNPPSNQYVIGTSWHYTGGFTPLTNSSGFISANTWTYFTVVKQSDGTTFLMINGQLYGSVNNVSISDPITTSGLALSIGGGTTNSVQVAWDMIRISNVARYTSDLTFFPPTITFNNDVNTWFLTDAENSYTPSPSPT